MFTIMTLTETKFTKNMIRTFLGARAPIGIARLSLSLSDQKVSE